MIFAKSTLSAYSFSIPNVMIENKYLLPQGLSNRILELQIDLDSQEISEQLLTETVQAYVEVISHFTALAAQMSGEEETDSSPYVKRSKIYQQKMKRLLARRDVQNCLGGKNTTFNNSNLHKQLKVVSQHAAEQAKALAAHYHTHLTHQSRLIESNITKQKTELKERIARRSQSRHKNPQTLGKLDLLLQPPKGKRAALLLNF